MSESGKRKKSRSKKSKSSRHSHQFEEDEKQALKDITPLVCKFLEKYAQDGKRRRIILEMIETERNYVNSLNILEEIYYKPLDKSISSAKPLIDSSTMSELFGNIDQIHEIHQNQILKVMDDCLPALKNPFPSAETYCTIANAFSGTLPVMQQLYTTYLSSSGKMDMILKRLKKNKKFCEFLNNALFNPKSKCQEIDDLLILPTQRIAGYKLLFERALKYLPAETHKTEHDSWTEAYQLLLKVGSDMNSEKVDESAVNRLLTISENLSKVHNHFCLMKPGRMVRAQFNAVQIEPPSETVEKKAKEKHLGLCVMNDILLIIEQEKNKRMKVISFNFVDAMPITQIQILPVSEEQLPDDPSCKIKSDTNEIDVTFNNFNDLANFRDGVMELRNTIEKKVEVMTENGKEYMIGILTNLKSIYEQPQTCRSRKDALESLQ